jgi:hypothetical protein
MCGCFVQSTAQQIQENIQSMHWSQSEGIIMEVPQIRELDSAVHLGALVAVCLRPHREVKLCDLA